MKRNIVYIVYILTCLIPAFSFSVMAHPVPEKHFTVVIDAGHGGNDPGAIGRRGREKRINLNVALKLGRLIEENCPDTRVVYTRKTDVFVTLHSRAEIANNAKADLFISIHTNSVASRNSRVCGAETYTLGLHRTDDNLEVAKKENSVILIEDDYKQRYAGFNPNSAESYIIFEFLQDKYMSQSVSFARMVQRQFRQHARRTDKGVHQAGFLVLRETSMPSVLIELGYITNPTEETYLLSENGATTMAKSIYRAFTEYRQHRSGQGEQVLPADVAETASEPENALQQQSEPETRPGTESTMPPADEPRQAETPSARERADKPVFKIQILTSGKVLPARSKQFKGLSPVGHYKENGIYKYTYGEDTNYNKILRLKRSQVDARFKDAFIIAFKNGRKMDVNQAIREFKRNR